MIPHMGRARTGLFAIPILLAMAAPAGVRPARAETPAVQDDLAGRYSGSAMEMAAALDLRADGRFDYWLSYGAVDETSSGRWRREGNRILLTSDPFTPPRIALARREQASTNIALRLDVPDGFSRQYFVTVVTFASGERRPIQLSEEGLVFAVDPADPPVSLRLALPIAMLESEVVPIDGAKGWRIDFRFEPNELGKVDLTDTPLAIEDGALILERYDRRVRFRPAR